MKAPTKPAKKSRKPVVASKEPVPTQLDENMSALVIAEYLVIDEVTEAEWMAAGRKLFALSPEVFWLQVAMLTEMLPKPKAR